MANETVRQFHDGQPPSIPDELERKAAEFLVQLQDDIVKRRVNGSYALGALRAMWAVVSGLTDKSVMDAIAELTNPIEQILRAKPAPDQLAILKRPGDVVVIVRRGAEIAVVTAAGERTLEPKGDDILHVELAAADLFKSTVERFRTAGYSQSF